MARVALSEVVLQYSGTSTLAEFVRGAEVFVYDRGTEEEAEVFAAEVGGEALEQPLSTGQGGQVVFEDALCWVETGSYDLSIDGQVVPWEAVRGSEAP